MLLVIKDLNLQMVCSIQKFDLKILIKMESYSPL